MASVLDLGLIDQFSSIFAIIFIFLITFAILEVTKILKQNQGVHALIALLVALMAATAPDALQIVTKMSPMFVVLLVFVFFLFLAAMFAGFKPDEVLSIIGGRPGASIWFIIVAIVILFFTLSGVYGQSLLEQFSGGGQPQPGTGGNFSTDTNTGTFNENFGATIFHPKILGLILIMLIGAFAIALLTRGGPM